MAYYLKVTLCFFLTTIWACSATKMDSSISANDEAKITFDLSQIDENGLTGEPTGRVSVDYEFCIPNSEKYIEAVKAIDMSIQISNSKGRSQCSKTQQLCVGNTHQKDWKRKLHKIAKLGFVKKIDRTLWE